MWPSPLISLYRAVGGLELHDLKVTRQFGFPPNGSEMKQFWLAEDDARVFATTMNLLLGVDEYADVIVVEVRHSTWAAGASGSDPLNGTLRPYVTRQDVPAHGQCGCPAVWYPAGDVMKIIRIQADLIFDGKRLAVMPGFRPTLLFADKKALCNIESIEPAPLPPQEHGTAIMALAWDWPQPCPVRVGMSFSALEGEKVVGRGNVTDVLSPQR